MKKILFLLSLFSSLSFATNLDTESAVKPVNKIYGLKCDKSLDGVIIKKQNNNIPPMICSSNSGLWTKFDFTKSSEFKNKKICFDYFHQMKNNQESVLVSAIKANNQEKVGEIIIKMHNSNESFFESNPQCKMGSGK